MSHISLSSYQYTLAGAHPEPAELRDKERSERFQSAKLAASITKEASLQTYFTIRYLADAEMVDDAYRSYAYFRWVDDILDDSPLDREERLAFLARQQEIIARCYRGEKPGDLCPQEILVIHLIQNDMGLSSGLRTYIDKMMAVMAFDVDRKDRFISSNELDRYTRSLAVAVTEALHYFIGHGDYSPRDENRYQAVTGAHITHMLRDAVEDAAAGYYNIPGDYLERHGIGPTNTGQDAYQAWVSSQVKLARQCFAVGREYLQQVENIRCRLAGYAYIARFEVVLNAIEAEQFVLRAAYPERKTKKAQLKMAWAAISQTIASSLEDNQYPQALVVPSLEMN